jgi:hypothetical protein
MTSDSDLDRLVRGADPAAGRHAPPVDTSPLALAAVRSGLSWPPGPVGPPGPPGGGIPLPSGSVGPDRAVGPAGAPGPAGAAGRGPGAGRRWLPVAASVAAVVAVVGLAAVVAGTRPDVGGRPAGSAGLSTPPAPGAAPGEAHTASAGPEYERSKRLLATLQAAVPDGYTVPDGGTGPGEASGPTSGPGTTQPTIGPDGSGMPAAYFQAVRDEGPYEGYQGYEYLADTIVSKGRQVGSLAARVWVGIPAWSTDPCVILDRVYWNDGSCRVVTGPGGERVGVVDADPGSAASGGDRRETQWAGYRRADGTVVLLSQGPGVLNDRIPTLDRPVFTAGQLAALATDRRFAA